MKTAFSAIATYATLLLLISGCGNESVESASAADAVVDVDSCTLLTAGEIEAATGVVPGPSRRPNPGLNNCEWPTPGEFVPIVYIGLSYKAADSWEEYREYMIENEFGDPEEDGERVEIEVFGYYMPDTAMMQVQTREGALITLRVRKGDKAQLVELAEKAAARLQ